MKVLVTGSNGQLGNEIRDLVSAYPEFEFVFLDRNELALDDLSNLEKIFDKYHPSFFINCAAYTAVDKAEEDQKTAMLINAEAVGRIAAYCKKCNCRLVHISTDYVFNGISDHPFLVDDLKGPLNIYGKTKLAGEELAVKENPEVMIIRTSWVYSSYGKNFVKTMIRLMQEKESINVVNDQLGSPTYAADLAHAILDILRSGKWIPGIYHYSNEGIISWYDFAVEIKALTHSYCLVNPVGSESFPTPAQRPLYSAMNTEKIKQTYTVPSRNWKESLADCIKKLSS
jgi:dTDP-4-dehydrorhamnose reductase